MKIKKKTIKSWIVKIVVILIVLSLVLSASIVVLQNFFN